MTTADTPPQTLPEVAQLAMENSQNIATLIEKFSELAATTAQVASEMADQLAAAHERLVQTVAGLVQEDRARLATLTTGLDNLRTDVSNLTASIAGLSEAQRETNDRVTQMNGHLTTLSGRVANLTGARYEKEASRLAQRHVRKQLNIINAAVTHTDWEPGPLVSNAVNSDEITDAEAEDLNRIDLVITGQDGTGNTVHAAAEISITVEPSDVTRAASRADILRKVTGQTVHAAVVGSSSTPEAIAMAERCKVIILTIPAPANEN
ncbi:MAG: hypothetical protein OXL37_06465 [Chloroflexota bacterium]|nr:hypothetical protein [Chloroflexota bacterium]MDE2959878.1 hypothetical protein [Chloroflexota bacterium]